MEAVLKNLTSTVELLAVATQSGVVQQWDKQTLSKAFQWARYCEHIFSKFHNNPAVRRVMETQLQVVNQSLRAALPGYKEVSFSDLSRCQHLLLGGLLNNPDVPSSIMKILFDTGPMSENDDVTGLCSHIIQCKSACKLLSLLADSSAVGADAEVQGSMLMESLGARQVQGTEARRTQEFLDRVLQGYEGATEHFYLVITAALLTENYSASQDCLLNWLQNKRSVLQQMCSALPLTLLMDLAKKHSKFRDAYCDLLKKWASDMEYIVNDGEWVQTSTNPTVSFQKLTEHFLALFEACPSLKECVKKDLKTLKTSDGDFNVTGLSVWGDLLSVLNK